MQRIQRQLKPRPTTSLGSVSWVYSLLDAFGLIDYCGGDAWGVWTAGLGIKGKVLDLLVFFRFFGVSESR